MEYIEDGMEYEEIGEPKTTYDKCPNKCSQLLISWMEANGPDDYRMVLYCPACEERFDE